MVRCFHIYGARRKGRDVSLKADAAHELRKPWPHRKAIELAKQRRMMKTDPPNRPVLNRIGKSRSGNRSPVVRRIVELDEEPILRKIRRIDELRIFDVVNGEVVNAGLAFQPDLGCIHKKLVKPSSFCNRQHLECRRTLLRRNWRRKQKKHNSYHPEMRSKHTADTSEKSSNHSRHPVLGLSQCKDKLLRSLS